MEPQRPELYHRNRSAGVFSVPNAAAGYQPIPEPTFNSGQSVVSVNYGTAGNPNLIGLQTPVEAEAFASSTRIWTIVTFVLVLLVAGGVIALGIVYAFHSHEYAIGEDNVKNPVESKVVEVIVTMGSGFNVCSGSHVSPNGQALTAVHCFQEPWFCDFNTTTSEFPLYEGDYLIEVMGVNGTGEKWTFYTQVLGWSGVTDIMVLQALPLTISRGGTIVINNQDYFKFGESHELQRTEVVKSLSFDGGFLKKLAHRGGVQAPGKDIGSDFVLSIEQVFYDGNSGPGSSGSGVFNRDGKLILAPLTFAWYNDNDMIFTVSGTSSDVSRQVVKRILNPAFPPNGPNNKYLVPTLGIAPLAAIGTSFLWSWDGPVYLPYTENRGIWFAYLLTQDFYDYLTNDVYSCGFDPYQVQPPSMLDAPLNTVISGEPPTTFPAVPGGCMYCSTMVVLEAVELTLNRNNWIPVGEDAGLGTVSGTIIGSGKWVGDVVRVYVRSFDPYLPADPTLNWEAIYLVTLKAVDPFWDTIFLTNVISHAASIHVNITQGHQTQLFIDPSIKLPKPLVMSKRTGTHTGENKISGLNRRSVASRSFQLDNYLQPIPPGSNVTTLPTLLESYQNWYNNQNQERRTKYQNFLRMRDEHMARHKGRERMGFNDNVDNQRHKPMFHGKEKFAKRGQHPFFATASKRHHLNPNYRGV